MTFFALIAAIVLALIFARLLWAILPFIFCFGAAYYFALYPDGNIDVTHFWKVFAVLALSIIVFKSMRKVWN